MTNSIRLALALFSLALCSKVLPAQPQAPPAQAGNQGITLDVVVTGKSGKPVAGLQQADFTVLDNNVDRPISSFEALGGPQAPLEVVLLVDAVNTDYTNLSFEREQIDNFLTSNGGRLAHPVSLAIFTDAGIQIQQGPSTDGNKISATLDKTLLGRREIRRSSQYERLDRFGLSLQNLGLLTEKESTRPGRKLIFWVSPGWPMLASADETLDWKDEQYVYTQVISISTVLRRNNITLYSIDTLGAEQDLGWESAYQEYLGGVKKPSDADLGDLSLQVIAVQSGGMALSGSNDVAGEIAQCMDDADAYYRISYGTPQPQQPNQYHRIQIKLSQPDLVARTRTGYYTEPAPAAR